MIATVRNLARAAFTTLGALELCLLRSRSSPFRLFRLCSVQAMETCIASPGSARSLSEPQSTGSHERLSSWVGFCSSFNPSLSHPPSWGCRRRSPRGRLQIPGSGSSGCSAGRSPGHPQKSIASPEVVTAAGARIRLASLLGQ